MTRTLVTLSAVLLFALPARASDGDSHFLGSFCLEASGRRILYTSSVGGESGCADTLLALDLQTLKSTTLSDCIYSDDTGDSESELRRRKKLLHGCAPLVPADLGALGLTPSVVTRDQPRPMPELPEDPSDSPGRDATYPRRVVLTQAGQSVGGLDFDPCLFTAMPQVATVMLLVLPGKPFAVLRVRHPGVCYETGYWEESFAFLPTLFGDGGAPASALLSPGAEPIRFVLRPPDVDAAELLLQAANQWVLRHQPAAAARYRKAAEESRAWEHRAWRAQGCLEKGGPRFVADAMVFDFETGTSSPRGPLEPPPAECTPVQSEWLDALGLVATLRPPPLPAIPADPSNFGRRCNQVLVLTRNGQPFAVHPFEGFCSGEAKLVAYPLPALKRTLFKLVVDGVAGDLFAVATPHARRSDRVLPTQAVNWLLLPSPWANAAQARNDAGMTLYRQERFDEAVAYFESAFQHSLGEGPALFLALFNQAATLARVGRKEGSLAVLRQLLSYSAHRARFVKKVRADQDFTSLREDPRLEALLTDVNCCLDGTLSERVKEVVRWTNGESVTVERVEVLAGVKQAEFNAVKGVDRTWYPSGQLSREAVLLHGEKSGVARRWYASGKLRLETTWRDGVKNGRERSWSDTGQLLSESSFVDGVRRGRQREWYPSGQLKSEFNDVKGVPTGQWWPEDAGTLGPSP